MTLSQLEQIIKDTREKYGDINVKIFVEDRTIDPRPRVLQCVGIDDIWRDELVMNP